MENALAYAGEKMKGIECNWDHFALSSSKIIYGSIYVMVLMELISEYPPISGLHY
jgi:hypothetical protein